MKSAALGNCVVVYLLLRAFVLVFLTTKTLPVLVTETLNFSKRDQPASFYRQENVYLILAERAV